VRLTILALGISTIYVAYVCVPLSHFPNGIPYSHLFLSDMRLRWSDWIFLPFAVANMCGVHALYDLPNHQPGPVRWLVVGWVASLPVSFLYALGLRAVARCFWSRSPSN